MSWYCPRCHGALRIHGGRLACAGCGRSYPLRDGLPVFCRPQPSPALLEELERATRRRAFEDAASRCCRRHDLARRSASPGLGAFLPVRGAARVLEWGEGVGDEALALSSQASEIACLVPDLATGLVLSRRLAAERVSNVSVAIGDCQLLPISDGFFQAVMIGAGFASRWRPGQLRTVAAELARVIEPGGCALLGLSRPWSGLAARWSPAAETLDCAARRRRAGAAFGLEALSGCMQACGFSAPELLAPLPHARLPRYVVCLDEPAGLRYLLGLMHRDRPRDAALASLAPALLTPRRLAALAPDLLCLFTRLAGIGQASRRQP
ncbi:MAG: methyltransferase domain-containing protein [Deltaproteobacteria bacterium]|nr:methyltransferase domain-containing protein [Deltaproteobacteria bacterium]